uniref:Uncharacterized protein n=1 Tax=Lepeophtheirus salmonis TaxID=72036 RepID=A0A0K2TZ15_LEPSM
MAIPIEFTILNANALIDQKMTTYEPLHPYELRSILLVVAARYIALSLKIPSLGNDDSWTMAGRGIKYFPTPSFQHHNMKRNLKKKKITNHFNPFYVFDCLVIYFFF